MGDEGGGVKRFELHRCQVTSGGSSCSGMQQLTVHARIEITLLYVRAMYAHCMCNSSNMGRLERNIYCAWNCEALEHLKLCLHDWNFEKIL